MLVFHELAPTVSMGTGKIVTVLGDDGRHWRVSPGLLSPVKDVDLTVNAGQSNKGRKKKRLR